MKREEIEDIIEYLENHTSPGTTIAEKLGLLREGLDSMHNLLMEQSEALTDISKLLNEYIEKVGIELMPGDFLTMKRCLGFHKTTLEKAQNYIKEHGGRE